MKATDTGVIGKFDAGSGGGDVAINDALERQQTRASAAMRPIYYLGDTSIPRVAAAAAIIMPIIRRGVSAVLQRQ